MSAIRLAQIRKQWGSTVALDGIELEIAPSSFCVLLGPSGCGKSTTLRIVAGLESASAGQVFIGGRDVTALPPAQRGISMVFQNYALFPHLSVADNITFGLSVRKVDKAETARRLEHAAQLLGLSALLQRKPSQLSGGQQQRVALGRALVAQTQVCLAIQNGVVLANDAGNAVRFDDPATIEALQYWVDLVKAGVHPPGIVEWGTTPKDFFERKVAMMWTTTGNLTNVRANAKFDFGVAMLPAGKRRGSPTGGGNFYISKKATLAQQEAAFRFIKWITQPERAARWSIDTGYVAVSQAAYDTAALRRYGAEFPPALVARDQLPHALAEFSTHDNQRVTKALNDGLQAALTGSKSPAQAMRDAQAEAGRLLRGYR